MGFKTPFVRLKMTKVYSDILDRMEKNTFKRQVEEWT